RPVREATGHPGRHHRPVGPPLGFGECEQPGGAGGGRGRSDPDRRDHHARVVRQPRADRLAFDRHRGADQDRVHRRPPGVAWSVDVSTGVVAGRTVAYPADVPRAARSTSRRSRTAVTTAYPAATTANPAATERPSRPGTGTRPSPPPATNASMSRVSEWANAVARCRSGTRSWMEESTASLAKPLATATTTQHGTAVGSAYRTAANVVTAAAATRPTACTTAGRRSRSRLPTATARNVPTTSAPL